jgi:hypothetical protein
MEGYEDVSCKTQPILETGWFHVILKEFEIIRSRCHFNISRSVSNQKRGSLSCHSIVEGIISYPPSINGWKNRRKMLNERLEIILIYP